tara:strand:+ start:75 stop:1139 length:1065 start_codon:yes stop_codon:yes gene_type:complete
MSILFSSLNIRGVEVKNRCWVSPMCQYSSEDGFANNWHLIHLGTRAVGGAGLVMTEAAAVSPEGRISPSDLGIWKDGHIEKLNEITNFLKSQNCVPAIQLAHSGRKGSTKKPWEERDNMVGENDGGWIPVAPSSLAFDNNSATPKELNTDEIAGLVSSFVKASKRAELAGFQCIEIHMAHGYLAHEFLSPISNKRTDEYGNNLKGRMKFPLDLIREIKKVISEKVILLVRISATDYVENGWDIEQSIGFCKELKDLGVDLIDCSSGGSSPLQKLNPEPNYQVPFSAEIKKQVGIKTGAVGLITNSHQAEEILKANLADVIFLGREFLRNPYWPLKAMKDLDNSADIPDQYKRSF